MGSGLSACVVVTVDMLLSSFLFVLKFPVSVMVNMCVCVSVSRSSVILHSLFADKIYVKICVFFLIYLFGLSPGIFRVTKYEFYPGRGHPCFVLFNFSTATLSILGLCEQMGGNSWATVA